MTTGIKQTEEVIALLPSVAKALEESLKDGKINILDAPKFFPVLGDIRVAIDGAKEIPAELADLSKEELLTLMQKTWDGAVAIVKAVVPGV